MRGKLTLAAIALLALAFAGNASAQGPSMPNPADSYCFDMGYDLQLLSRYDGAQYSICVFPDGTQCDTWEFFEGACGTEYSYCATRGYDMKVVTDGRNYFTKNFTVCVDRITGENVGSVAELMNYNERFLGRQGPPQEVTEPVEAVLHETRDPGQPAFFDWRVFGGFDWTTPVKNQSQCGACWAFSAVGATESAYNLHQNSPNLDIDLSEEYVNTNCNGHGQHGCCGGWHDAALGAIRDNGVPDDECLVFDVPTYQTGICSCGGGNPCGATCPNGGGGTSICSLSFCDDACLDVGSRLVYINDYHGAGANDRTAMKNNIMAHGPISVALDFGCTTGADDVCRCDCSSGCSFTHAVVITGWDDTMGGGEGAWIIKNSWGAGDGPLNDGYRFIRFGDCRIEELPYWVEPADMYFPIISVPGSVTFEETCVGETAIDTLDVCNTGMDNLRVDSITSSDAQFAVTEPSSLFPVTISPDFCFPFQVTYTPSGSGAHAAILTIESNEISAERAQVMVDLFGDGTVQDIDAWIADAGDFGDVCLGDYRDLDLTIANSGDCDLTVSNITSSDSEFEVAGVLSFPVVIGPGNSTAVPIRFVPTGSFNGRSATITVTSDDPDTPTRNIAVSGNVPPGDVRVTGSTDFGDVCAETLAEQPVAVCNVGACDLHVSDVSVDCADFTLINNPFPATVSPDSCMDVMVRFTPTSAGPKSCQLTITSDDPDTGVINLTLTANTPFGSIDVPPDQPFTPTVIQSVDACSTENPFPVSNTGICNLTIPALWISDNPDEYSLPGLPSFPIILEPGHIVGEGDLRLQFAPLALDRDLLGEVSVTYVYDPITGDTVTVMRNMCGEGVRTGARVLVTHNGTPMDMVKSIKLNRVNANSNRPRLDTVDNARDLPLETVTPDGPCLPFQYHREYATVSNPIQLLPGSYRLTVTARINNKNKHLTVGFDVSSCDFNATIVVDFDDAALKELEEAQEQIQELILSPLTPRPLPF